MMVSDPISPSSTALGDLDARDNAPLEGARVLICEDEAIIHIQLNKILTHAGLDVVGNSRRASHGTQTDFTFGRILCRSTRAGRPGSSGLGKKSVLVWLRPG